MTSTVNFGWEWIVAGMQQSRATKVARCNLSEVRERIPNSNLLVDEQLFY